MYPFSEKVHGYLSISRAHTLQTPYFNFNIAYKLSHNDSFRFFQISSKIEVLVAEIFMATDSFLHQSLELSKMRLIHLPWRTSIFVTERCRHSYDFTHHCSGPHHADGTKGNMSHTDITSGHEKIIHISGIKASVRHCTRINSVVHGSCLELCPRESL